MRRGGTLHPPIPRAPAATLQAPFIPIEAEVFHTNSCDFKDQATEKVQDLLKKGGDLWERGERQQTLSWDQLSPRCCENLKASSRSGKKPQPQIEAVF